MKIGALIPVRLASERLPGKALMDICSRPVIYHLLDRVVASPHISNKTDVVVCTTVEESDDRLETAVKSYGCSVFRGSVDDIIRRFGGAIESFGFDAVIQVDGDDPLSAQEYMTLTMDRLLDDRSLDIVTSEGLPLGCNVKSFTRNAMGKVLAAYRTERNDTGFEKFFTKSGLCNHITVGPAGPDHVHGSARLTLDYKADFDVFRQIFDALYHPGEIFGLTDVVRFLRANPQVVEMNRHVEEEYWQRHSAKSVLEYETIEGGIGTISS